MSLLPLDTRELFLQSSTSVLKPVALLGGNVTTPVADLDVALDKGGMQQRLGELVSQRDGLLSTGGNFAIGTVGKGDALLDGILLALGIGADNSVLGNVVGRKLQLGLLLQGLVGRVGVGVESNLDVLLVGLIDAGGKRAESREDRVGDGEGDLLLGSQGRGQLDAIVLDRAAELAHDAA